MSALRKVEELAERHGLFSEHRRRSRDLSPPPGHAIEGPWIAMSRQAGSRGTELAAAVARTLGWPAYDRELLSAIAAETRTSETLLERFDERAVREFEEYLAPLIVPKDPGQARYILELRRVVSRLARQGPAVFVGRGAKCILDPKHGLRVRAVGPLEERAAEVSRTRNVPLAEARRLVLENDAAQRKFIRQAFRKDIDDPLGFDLVVNVAQLGFLPALEAVIAAARAKLSF